MDAWLPIKETMQKELSLLREILSSLSLQERYLLEKDPRTHYIQQILPAMMQQLLIYKESRESFLASIPLNSKDCAIDLILLIDQLSLLTDTIKKKHASNQNLVSFSPIPYPQEKKNNHICTLEPPTSEIWIQEG